MMKTKAKFLPIHVALYRLHVIVTWGTTGKEIVRYMQRHKCEVASRFESDFTEQAEDALGLCMEFSTDTPDVLVWLRERPKRSRSYGVLYHELYHAVDSISESRNLKDEQEARAYLFEYLADQANSRLWPR